MKRDTLFTRANSLVSALVAAGACGAVQGAPPSGGDPDLNYIPTRGCGKAQALRAMAARGWQWGEGETGATTREAATDTDVLSNTIDFEVFPATDTITGSNTMTVRSLVNGLTKFTFRLRSNYTITQILLNGTTTATAVSVGSYGRETTLDRAYNAGEQFTIKVSYTGVAVSRGFGSINFSTQGGFPLIETLSEAYFAATWWPCKDGDFGQPGDNSDKATMSLSVTAPDTLRTVSNGLLQSVTVPATGKKKHTWVSNYPASTYLVCFATTKFNTWTQTYNYGTGTMPVEFNIWPSSDTPSNRAAWEKCLQMLATYKDVYGLYPFINEKYGIYQFSFGGGMEHQTNTGQGTFSEGVTAHELGHQWWGDNVTCRTWGDIWLNESFATYSESLWEERKPGSSGFAAYKASMADHRPSAVGDSVYVYSSADMNRIFDYNYTYAKGSWVLHMLRHVVGDVTFFNILAAHRAAHQGSAATTDDFKNVASAAAGTDLGYFINQWIYGIGAPTYQYAFQNVTINGQKYVRLYLKQVQTASYGIYTMPVDVRVNYTGGSALYKVWNNAQAEHFVIPVGTAATSITLDPDDWILNEGKASTAWVNGPPKLVQTTPALGSIDTPPASTSQVTLTFSENVTSTAADFSVTRNATPVSFTHAYNASNFTTTLSFGSNLPAGVYTVTAKATLKASISNIGIDGEIANPASPASLPSGDGLTGGAAAWTFTVQGCPADFNGDTSVDDFDFFDFLNAFNGNAPAADFNGDTSVDDFDYFDFLNAFNTPC
ncbi:MAG: hypothetical protein JNM07_10030 [Phycisphaerae bacterium]|nr:hypothetical protein [Phycisphaerae bacterium]